MRAIRCAHPSITAVLMAFATLAVAQTPPTAEDYARWERLGSGSFSPDGRVFAFTLRRENGESELHVRVLAAADPVVVKEGGNQEFSSDSHWLAYLSGHSEAEREKLSKAKKPVRSRLGLRDLILGTTHEFKDVSSFRFSDDGRYLAMRGYAIDGRDSGGVDLVVRDLEKNTDTNFGNVGEYAWQDEGALLAMTIDAESQSGNGVLVFQPRTGVLRTLVSGRTRFLSLTWRPEDDDLAALRAVQSAVQSDEDGKDDEDGNGEDAEEPHDILAWRNLEGDPQFLRCEPRARDDFPGDKRVVPFRGLKWSEDGARLFFGIQDWEGNEAAPDRPEEAGIVEKGDDKAPIPAEDPGEKPQTEPAPQDPAEVDVWHSRDRRIIPMQKAQADRDRQRSYLSVWHLDADRYLQLGTDLMDSAEPLAGERFALEHDTDPYAIEGMWGRRFSDVYLTDASTGERNKVLERLEFGAQGSSTGRYSLYFREDHHWTFDVETGKHTCLTENLETSFVNEEYDYPVKQKPSYRSGGWLKGDQAVLLYDEFDIWSVAPDGSSAKKLTAGADTQLRHRIARLDFEEDFIDPQGPIYISLFGKWTKKSGYARLAPDGAMTRLILEDASVGRLLRAEDFDAFAYVVQDFDDSPDYFVAGTDLSSPRQISNTNGFQKEMAWGHSELLDYTNRDGVPLQAALFYPAGYQEGVQYPMIVYVYEMRSQVVHNYVNPSERRPYNTSVFTTQGYFVMQPDIVYKARDPGISATDCVLAAVEKAVATGAIDKQAIGLVGHSWGGYEATFIPTQTDVFAATVAGAPLTNFLSFMGQIHWSGGLPETSHWETGQARMDVPYWVDFEAHLRNSPAHFITQLSTPMLMAFGNKDGSVDWHQGVEFYNFARRAEKEMVLLVYEGEGHGLRKKPNQIDYHHRVLDWFDHHLKGAEPKKWISEGVPYLQREEELGKLKGK